MKPTRAPRTFTPSWIAGDTNVTSPEQHAPMHLDERARAAVRVFVTGYILSVTSWYLGVVLLAGR